MILSDYTYISIFGSKIISMVVLYYHGYISCSVLLYGSIVLLFYDSIYVVLSFCLCSSLLFCCSVCSLYGSIYIYIYIFFSIFLLFYLWFCHSRYGSIYNVKKNCVQSMALSLCLWFCLVLFFLLSNLDVLSVFLSVVFI